MSFVKSIIVASNDDELGSVHTLKYDVAHRLKITKPFEKKSVLSNQKASMIYQWYVVQIYTLLTCHIYAVHGAGLNKLFLPQHALLTWM